MANTIDGAVRITFRDTRDAKNVRNNTKDALRRRHPELSTQVRAHHRELTIPAQAEAVTFDAIAKTVGYTPKKVYLK